MNNFLKNEQGTNPEKSTDVPKVIQVIEEFATLDKQVVETGKVRIIKTIVSEETSINVPIINESYHIEHIKVPSQIFDEAPTVLSHNGDVTIIKVLREISVVVKKYELVEEIHITRQLSQTPLMHEVILRKEKVHVERSSNSSSE